MTIDKSKTNYDKVTNPFFNSSTQYTRVTWTHLITYLCKEREAAASAHRTQKLAITKPMRYGGDW